MSSFIKKQNLFEIKDFKYAAKSRTCRGETTLAGVATPLAAVADRALGRPTLGGKTKFVYENQRFSISLIPRIPSGEDFSPFEKCSC